MERNKWQVPCEMLQEIRLCKGACCAVVETRTTTSTPGSNSFQIPSQGETLRQEHAGLHVGQGGE